jgi:ribosomal protein S18 acetylase RimI-like enzyme
MQIRELAESDLAACARLYGSVFAAEPWNERWAHDDVERRLREIHRTPGAFGLTAHAGGDDADDDADDDDGTPDGFVAGYAEQWGDARHFYVKEMCVGTDRQRRGVGSALMAALTDALKRRGVTKVYLLTARGGPAQAFYARCGFYTSEKMVLMGKYLA